MFPWKLWLCGTVIYINNVFIKVNVSKKRNISNLWQIKHELRLKYFYAKIHYD